MKTENSIRKAELWELEGFRVGNAQNFEAGTGCTVILCPDGAVCGVDVRGAAPASRETELLRPVNMIERVHGVMLSGGSAFGLAAADGAMQFLSEKGYGFETGFGVVPIVCGASLFDLATGRSDVRPDPAMGYAACKAAEKGEPVLSGNFGAGTGASVGKYLGASQMMKGGLGIAAFAAGNVKCAAIVAVNCLGDVRDTESGKILAGVLNEEKNRICSTGELMLRDIASEKDVFGGNTTLGCILTNAGLTKSQCNKLASVTHNAYARAILPVHTSADGDTIFAMSFGNEEAAPDALGVLAVLAMERAIADAVRSAQPAYGIPAACSLE